ncbi:hypothetical protein CVT25_011978 [Psilocybe cyanescens]|uniref:Uncharacterized protein n=1 Tax=Psilocybe cyanescens TaxID=93625 RepID=A0A409XLG9_PSICY|nr:hypothetical protein CVT25_011978 [Psilocybe cyanescens]
MTPAKQSTPYASHQSPSNQGEISTIISQHTQLADEDNQDNELVRISNDWTSLRIIELFNFQSDIWSNRYVHFTNLSFEEELAFKYDLLDVNANGGDDHEVNFDPLIEGILIG